jgi:hypothetical protein
LLRAFQRLFVASPYLLFRNLSKFLQKRATEAD